MHEIGAAVAVAAAAPCVTLEKPNCESRKGDATQAWIFVACWYSRFQLFL